jgi:hypothetical protein
MKKRQPYNSRRGNECTMFFILIQSVLLKTNSFWSYTQSPNGHFFSALSQSLQTQHFPNLVRQLSVTSLPFRISYASISPRSTMLSVSDLLFLRVTQLTLTHASSKIISIKAQTKLASIWFTPLFSESSHSNK